VKILMTLFSGKHEGTFYRAFPWAAFLVSRGHDVTLLCTSADHLFCKKVSIEHGVRIVEAPSLLNGGRVMARLTAMCGWGPLDIATRYKEIRNGRYDIVHAFEHHPHVALPVYLAGRKHIPVLIADWCDHYGQGGLREFSRLSPYYRLYKLLGMPFQLLLDHLEVALRRRADAVTVISFFLRQRAIRKGVPEEKIHRITGSAEIELIQPRSARTARVRLGLDENLHYALFFGAGQFDVDFSLEAFVRILQKQPAARFIIIGKKDVAVTRRSTALGIQDKVIQTGWIDEAQLSDWLACADVCLLPMKDTPVNLARWPNKIGFYMAAGRPTVATAVGDVGRLIAERGIGMVARVHPDDFAERVLYLFEHRDEAATMGLRARQLAETEFAPAVQGAEVERLYLNLLGACHG
jgi:glycosyltransferase involved in cell wall biosynthesis